ncbi:MAG TPA: circularly permuted type 2 ATP-grasp protein, partial [Methylomirabilota bacterium]
MTLIFAQSTICQEFDMKWIAAKTGFDEVFGRGQTPRAHYASLVSILESFTLEDVARRERLQRLALMNQGITFTVYGEKEGLERIFPFDFVPRIIPAAEWKLIQDGLVQRITTLNLFLLDVYGDQ